MGTTIYSIKDDTVVQITGLPRITPGAPDPLIFADERKVVMSYWVAQPTEIELAKARSHPDRTDGPDVYAIFCFRGVHSHMFGYPNEEAYDGHPLTSRGLRPFGIYEVGKSSWIARMEHMNSVHPAHTKDMFDSLRHLVFGFHDSTFEILTREFDLDLMNDHSNRINVFPRMRELLRPLNEEM